MKSPNLIAAIRALETLVLCSFAASVFLVWPQLATAFESKAAFETFDWRTTLISIAIGTLAALYNYLTAFFTAAGKNQTAVNSALQTLIGLVSQQQAPAPAVASKAESVAFIPFEKPPSPVTPPAVEAVQQVVTAVAAAASIPVQPQNTLATVIPLAPNGGTPTNG